MMATLAIASLRDERNARLSDFRHDADSGPASARKKGPDRVGGRQPLRPRAAIETWPARLVARAGASATFLRCIFQATPSLRRDSRCEFARQADSGGADEQG